MQKDESTQAETTSKEFKPWPVKAYFVTTLTIIYVFAEASFVHDLHTLRIHNALSDSLLSAIVFQLNLLISFLFYLLSIRKWRNVRIGAISWNPSTMQISLALMSLLQGLMMERGIAVAVYRTKQAIAP
jgi:hypothetical protein